MPELLIEFLSEEIPARMQARAAADLARLMGDALREADLAFEAVRTMVTPRRLAIVIEGIPAAQPDRRIERKGPRTSAPQQAIDGFLGANGLTLDQCEVREDKKGDYYVAVIEQQGQPAAAVLAIIVADAAHALGWPKSMRWGATGFRWVRPLHSVLALFDGAPLDGAIDLGGAELRFGDTTRGHRFLAPDAFSVKDADDYKARLRSAYVMVDPADRRENIEADLAIAAAQHNLEPIRDEALLEEVAGLVEWPVVLVGTIDDAFMDLPPEVLTTSMRNHQKYFALRTKGGTFAPKFAFVANMLADDGGSAIVAGNERVLRARLSDAQYFWDLDRATALEARVPALDGIVFHARLGSLGERVARMQTLAAELAWAIPGCDRDKARSAALLAKADLVSGMVGEFPELQGLMGRYYALGEGEAAEVADAIAAHYAPQGPNDSCPTAPVSIAVALADKLDTLIGFWAIDEKPTGSKDPYALRRAALGIIRLVLENDLRLPLRGAFTSAAALYSSVGAPDIEDLLGFFVDRLKVHMRADEVPHDHIQAVFALAEEDDLVRIVARVRALGAFLGTDDGANLLTAYRRAANIVRAEERKDEASFAGADYDPALAEQDESGAEADLWAVLSEIESGMDTVLAAERFADAMALLARMRGPVDRFFDAVTVNIDDAALRRNRLCLLARIQQVMNRVADFSQIEG
ncbi:MAG: glycine--tRNA ligase subunit beta [Alphaproteobacteria bacterium]|jgi:glycyl-tRNA synthetase beta chain